MPLVNTINTILDGIPTYRMSLLPIPAKVEKQLDKIRRDFLWDGNTMNRRTHLGKLDTVRRDEEGGGLWGEKP